MGDTEMGNFVREKIRVLKWIHAPKQLDSHGAEEPLDQNINAIISAMNERLSFLYTTASCGGHFYSADDIRQRYPNARDDELVLPNDGLIMGFGGYICFVVDDSDTSKQFIGALKQIVSQRPGSQLHRRWHRDWFTLELIPQLAEDDAFTCEEAVRAKQQIQDIIEELMTLTSVFIC